MTLRGASRAAFSPGLRTGGLDDRRWVATPCLGEGWSRAEKQMHRPGSTLDSPWEVGEHFLSLGAQFVLLACTTGERMKRPLGLPGVGSGAGDPSSGEETLLGTAPRRRPQQGPTALHPLPCSTARCTRPPPRETASLLRAGSAQVYFSVRSRQRQAHLEKVRFAG